MTQKQKAIRTTMYSVDEVGGQVVTHQLPWPKDSEKLTPLKARGFTFEKPNVNKPTATTEVTQMTTTQVKWWANMNATERKAYQKKAYRAAKKG